MEVENISAISVCDIVDNNSIELLNDGISRQRLDSDAAGPNRSSDGSSDSPRCDRSGSVSDGQKQKMRKHRRVKGGEHHRRRRQSSMTEERRASLGQQGKPIRHDRFRRGKPMAPYNTNQYLMEQYEPTDITFQLDYYTPAGIGAGDRCGSYDSDGDFSYENGFVDEETEENFFAKDFAETYQTFRAERLQAMAKEDLIRELVAMETKVEQLESLASRPSAATTKKLSAEKALEAEIERLARENRQLMIEFDNYRRLHC